MMRRGGEFTRTGQYTHIPLYLKGGTRVTLENLLTTGVVGSKQQFAQNHSPSCPTGQRQDGPQPRFIINVNILPL